MGIEDKTCISCEGVELIDKAAQGYINSSRYVTVNVDQVDGSIVTYQVFRGSISDAPRDEAIVLVGQELEQDAEAVSDDPLRCASGCEFLLCAATRLSVVEVDVPKEDFAKSIFYSALTVVNEQYRKKLFNRI